MEGIPLCPPRALKCFAIVRLEPANLTTFPHFSVSDRGSSINSNRLKARRVTLPADMS